MAMKRAHGTSLRKNLECPVCYDDYNGKDHIPKSMVCGHTACTSCLRNLLDGIILRCPICKTISFIHTKDVNLMPTNFAIQSIVESSCQDCKIAPKSDKCLRFHCDKELCESCRDRHIGNFDTVLKNTAAELNEKITRLQNDCAKDGSLCEMVTETTVEITNIEKTCQELIERVETLKNDTVAEMQAKMRDNTDLYVAWKDNMNQSLTEAQGVTEQIHSISGRGQDFSIEQKIELFEKCKDLDTVLSSSLSAKPVFTKCEMKSTFNDLSLSSHLVVKYINPCTPDVETAQASEITIPYRDVSCRVVYSGSESSKLDHPCGVGVSPNTGTIVISNLHDVHILSSDYQLTARYTGHGSNPGKLKIPYGVAINQENKIFVSDTGKHNIHVIDEQGEFLCQIGSRGTGPGQFIQPRGLAVDEDGHIFVCDSSRIQVLGVNGSYIREFGSRSSDAGQFCSPPCFIAASQKHDRIVVSDLNQKVYIFSYDGFYHGTIKHTNKTINDGSESPMLANGVAIDHKGNIFVADLDAGYTLVFDTNLKFIGCVSKTKVHALKPTGLAQTNSGDIILCDGIHNHLMLFQISQFK